MFVYVRLGHILFNRHPLSIKKKKEIIDYKNRGPFDDFVAVAWQQQLLPRYNLLRSISILDIAMTFMM